MAQSAGPRGSWMSPAKLGFTVLVFAMVILVAANRNSVNRVLRSGLAGSPLGVAAGGVAGTQVPRLPNCGLLPKQDSAAKQCADEGWKYFDANKSQFWGGSGFERAMSEMFSKDLGSKLFPRSRPITIVHVGAHMGSMLDRYAALLRGPRLDDRIIMIEPNPANVERLTRRIRLDPRLSIVQAAAYDKSGKIWFEYSGVPNTLGNGGRVKTTMPENVTFTSEVEGKGLPLQAVTLDELLADRPVIDFIMMDAEGHEPFILQGAANVLRRTRFVVFGCAERWKQEIGASFDPLSPFALLSAAGMSSVLLGEKQNLFLDAEASNADAARNLPSWGFCMAMHVAPPMLSNGTALAAVLAGPQAAATTSSCYVYSENLQLPSCKDGRLIALGDK